MRLIAPSIFLSMAVISGCSDTTTTAEAAPKPAPTDAAAPKTTSSTTNPQVTQPEPAFTAASFPQKDGFTTKVVGTRLWVFRAGSPELSEFEKTGDLAKQAMTMGPDTHHVVIKGPDTDTIDAYLKAIAK